MTAHRSAVAKRSLATTSMSAWVMLLVLALTAAPPAQKQDDTDKPAASRYKKMIGMYYQYKSEAFENIAEITADSLLSILEEKKCVILDVREKREREISIIPGAITQKEFDPDRRRYKDSTIVVYCTIGYRSGVYTRKLRKKGLRAFNLVGGVLAWAHAKEKFVRDTTSTRRVHVYGKKWDLAPAEYDAVW